MKINDKNKILTNKNIKRNEDEKLMLETCSLKIHDSQHSSFISRTNIKFQELLKLTMPSRRIYYVSTKDNAWSRRVSQFHRGSDEQQQHRIIDYVGTGFHNNVTRP